MRANSTCLSIAAVVVAASLTSGCTPSKQVKVTTDPADASIYLDGVEGGVSPLSRDLSFPKGHEYQMLVRKEGYKDSTIVIAADPRDMTEYHVVLQRVAKTVTIKSTPSGATVYINGLDSGITPLTKELSFARTASYQICVRKESYEDYTFTATLEPLSNVEFAADLKKLAIISTKLVSFEPTATDKGPRVAVVVRPALAYLEVMERSPSVKSVTQVTANQDRSLQISAPVLSPLADALAYAQYVEEEGGTSYSNLWTQTVGSYAKTRITYGKYLDLTPCFTPDGQYVVFGSNRTSPNQTLWRTRIEGGGGITKITDTMAEDYSPSISTDGRRIIYASLPTGAEETQVWSVDANGSLPTQLREGEFPQISPNGERILFVRKDKTTNHKHIWVMAVDGSGETQLTQNLDYDTLDPRWSPDGRWIVYASDEGLDSKQNHNFDIWMMASNGAQKVQLTTNGSRDDSPCWDHAGKSIYFRSNRGGVWNIWRFSPTVPGGETITVR